MLIFTFNMYLIVRGHLCFTKSYRICQVNYYYVNLPDFRSMTKVSRRTLNKCVPTTNISPHLGHIILLVWFVFCYIHALQSNVELRCIETKMYKVCNQVLQKQLSKLNSVLVRQRIRTVYVNRHRLATAVGN